MKLFGKEIGRGRNKVSGVPAEVQDYYKSERRERTGLVWMLAAGTLVVTLLLASGLFFGGRWAYRQLTDNSRNQTQQDGNAQNQGTTSGENPQATNVDNSGGQTSSTNTDATTQPPQSQSGQTAGATTTPTTGESNALVSTGPTD